MPRTCTICTHHRRREIDRSLVARTTSYRDIARQHGVSKDAISRHVREHLPELLAKAHEAEQVAEADKLLMDIRKLQARTLIMLQNAEKAGDLRTALAAVREARGNVALLAELRGQLDRRPQVNIYLSPQWISLRTAIIGALERHPLAKEDVLLAISGAQERSDNG